MKSKYSLMLLVRLISTGLLKRGLVMGALTPEISKLEEVPEYQRSWYVGDGAGKFKIDLSKVDTEDVTPIKSALETTRKERDTQKRITDQAVKDALKQYEGIDPIKVRDILNKFSNEEEAALIAAGKMDQVIEKRMAKAREELQNLLDAEKAMSKNALEKATKYAQRVLDNEIRAAVTGKVHDSALKSGDILRAAREIFTLDADGRAVQLDNDGEVVMGRDSKNPFSPEEWIESMKSVAPHWFPSQGSGGNAPGSKSGPAMKDMTGMSPQQRMTEARKQKHGTK